MPVLNPTSLHCQELPYQRDSAERMAGLGQLPHAVLLDSAGALQGRWDICSALPCATLTATDAGCESSESLPEDVRADFFGALRWLLQKYTDDSKPGEPWSGPDLPFRGGALGYVGYPRLLPSGSMQISNGYFGIYRWALVVDHAQRRSFLFFLPGFPSPCRRQVLDALEKPRSTLRQFKLLRQFSQDVSRTDYGAAFNRIKDYIAAGDCYQVNLTQRFSSEFRGDPLEAYLRLRNQVGNPMSAFVAAPEATLLSFSPERFLSLRGRQVLTQPIKGTRPRSRQVERDTSLANELQSSEKDRAENLMIVDLLRNDLGVLCEYGSIIAEQLFELQSFSNVHHLISTVSGTLTTHTSAIHLLQNCFPGGSITGAPKIRAMEIIQELETNDREAYCGSVAYVSFHGDMDSSITIRSLLCRENALHCWAGGGIVDDSREDQEYQESLDKIDNLIKGLN